MRRRQLICGAAAAAGLMTLPARASASTSANKPTVRVGLYQAKGVHPVAFAAEKELLEKSPGFTLKVLRPADIQAGALAEQDVVVFMGGSGTSQGRALGDDGKLAVKRFVADGGGYVGVCAGAYLALQGEDEFHKLRLVAGRNLTGDFWQRGIAGLEVKAEGRENFKLFFANGPIFTPAPTEGLAPYTSLATFVGEIYNEARGTGPGEMPGTPAIVAAPHGAGRVLLFSPNPVLGGAGVVQADLMLTGLRWSAARAPMPATLKFADVFS
jgi:putative intracellular protease/amidase